MCDAIHILQTEIRIVILKFIFDITILSHVL